MHGSTEAEMILEDVNKLWIFSWASPQVLWMKGTYLWIRCVHQFYFTLFISCYLKLSLSFLKFLFIWERQTTRESICKGRVEGEREAQPRWVGCPKRRGIPGPGSLAWAEGFSPSTNEDGLAVALCLLPSHYHLVIPLDPYKHWSYKYLRTTTNALTVILCSPECCQGCGAAFCPPKLSEWLSTLLYDKPAPFGVN